MKLTYQKTKVDNFNTVNQILQSHFNVSTNLKKKLIKNKYVLVNNHFIPTNIELNDNDIISIDFSYSEDNDNIVPTRMLLNILYEDEWLLAIYKPPNIAVHPSFSYHSNTLSNGVRNYFDEIGLKKKIRIVNRLDLDTSGIILFAKCEYIHDLLIKQMNNNDFKKQYLCFCENAFDDLNISSTINKPIGRKEGSIIERCICSDGLVAITHYIPLQNFNNISNNESHNYSLVECFLETGRTHQIRLHLASIGHPILGDTLYGNKHPLIRRQALHSSKLCFTHPITLEKITLTSPLPDDLSLLLNK